MHRTMDQRKIPKLKKLENEELVIDRDVTFDPHWNIAFRPSQPAQRIWSWDGLSSS
jgi:hypothetical protein